MDEFIEQELKKCLETLETYYKGIVDIEFVVENKKLYILSACPVKLSASANLRITMEMFCKGKLTVEEVIERLSFQQMEKILDFQTITNVNNLKLVMQGVSASSGVCTGNACFTHQQAVSLIQNEEGFIYCCVELSPEDIDIIKSPFCRGVISTRGGMTSHAAVICRSLQLPCVTGTEDYNVLECLIKDYNGVLSVDGNKGKVYAGTAIIENKKSELQEITMLRKLLSMIIEYNIITTEKSLLVWRLWNVIMLNRRYIQKENKKRIVYKDNYISFKQPTKTEQEVIKSQLGRINHGEFLVEDLIDFLQSQMSANVPLGCHYKYMRPLLDPINSMTFDDHFESASQGNPCGMQLTGVEFFNVNRFVDFLIDIYSIKIYFTTTFFRNESGKGFSDDYFPLNYLDYTNPNGEGLIINSYNANRVAIFINDVLVKVDELPIVYHLIRKRQYYWTWYEDNNVSKKEIVNYLKSNMYKNEFEHSKNYYLCDELSLIRNNELTLSGKSIIGEDKMKNKVNIDCILDEVITRGYDEITNECNDFLELLKRKDFKELIALELYELYFWNGRHEFDLELLREIINTVADYFSDPETIKQIEAGLLQNLPSTIVISMVGAIWLKLKGGIKKESATKEKSSWESIEENIKKIDNEFSNHDYILSNEIEQIFKTSREEIQPLLKLCGCKCYINKNRSIWIKVGTKEARIKEILKEHNFRYKK